jgi:hypothetical protein
MAKHDIGISNQFALQPPLRPDHFLSGEGLFVAGQLADNRTGATLITLFQGVSTGTLQILYEFKIRFNPHSFSHDTPPVNLPQNASLH